MINNLVDIRRAQYQTVLASSSTLIDRSIILFHLNDIKAREIWYDA